MNCGLIPNNDKKIFPFQNVQTGYGPHPAANQWVPQAHSQGVKQQGREADL